MWKKKETAVNAWSKKMVEMENNKDMLKVMISDQNDERSATQETINSSNSDG